MARMGCEHKAEAKGRVDMQNNDTLFMEKALKQAAVALRRGEVPIGAVVVDADGCVTGATHPTADTIRPALQIIGLQEGFKIASSYFLMLKDDLKLFYADCGFVINPNEIV